MRCAGTGPGGGPCPAGWGARVSPVRWPDPWGRRRDPSGRARALRGRGSPWAGVREAPPGAPSPLANAVSLLSPAGAIEAEAVADALVPGEALAVGESGFCFSEGGSLACQA